MLTHRCLHTQVGHGAFASLQEAAGHPQTKLAMGKKGPGVAQWLGHRIQPLTLNSPTQPQASADAAMWQASLFLHAFSVLFGIYLLAMRKETSELRQIAFSGAHNESSMQFVPTKWKLKFASLWLHQSSTIRPQHGWPAGAGPALQPSCLAPWSHCLSATTKHKLVVTPWPLVKCSPNILISISKGFQSPISAPPQTQCG